MLRREAEFGINISGPLRAELRSLPLVEDRYVLICRNDHALAGRRRLRWRQLAGQPLIFAGDSNSNRPLLDAAMRSAGVDLQAFYEVQRSSTAVGLVAAGVAAAIVPRLAIQPGAYPNIQVIPLANPVVSRSLVLLWRRTAHLSPAAQGLFDMLPESAHSRP